MKLTFTLKTWILLAAAIIIGVFYSVNSFRESDRLVDAIIAADQLGDESIYIDPQGFGGVSPAIEHKQTIETVISYINRMMEHYPEHIWTRNNSEYSLAQMYRKEDKFAEALELYKKVAAGETHHKENAKHWVSILSQPDEDEQSPSIVGKVWLGDQPASKVYVYVREKDANSWHSNPIGTYRTTVTNDQGEYALYNISPGDYYVGIGLAPKRLEGYVLAERMINYVTVKEGETSTFDVYFTKQMTVYLRGIHNGKMR